MCVRHVLYYFYKALSSVIEYIGGNSNTAVLVISLINGLIWVIPNMAYFRKRKSLFTNTRLFIKKQDYEAGEPERSYDSRSYY